MPLVTDAATLAAQLWQQALNLNPQTAIYGIRTAATTTTGADTFVYYKLVRVTTDTKAGVTIDEQKIGNMMVETILPRAVRKWWIYQKDLDTAAPVTAGLRAPAPKPQVDYTLQIQGQIWVIKKIVSTAIDFVWQCSCWLER